MGIFGRIFGSEEAIKRGGELIDDAFYTDQEEMKDNIEFYTTKVQKKIELLEAFGAFKITQRYIALVSLFNFTMSFQVVLWMTIFEKDTKNILTVISTFQVGYIMMIIMGFYFSGGVVNTWETAKNFFNKTKPKENK